MGEHSFKESMTKSYEYVGIHNHRKKLYETTKKRKNCAILRCFNQWIEQSDKIPDWLTQG